ncbi:type II toxin-antitoxin system RelE/ParE family toxin [Trichormus sp. NMC-1]|uniref:type II toxin-antitoxin system RelE family toxin n=1 Tax=Trichormus sp. NMC-1 TaxID=1853259 RepID=UPI0008DC16E5|nr:type II toxin-antitoxin system RelE/ParE family toxin [Trichormus sp. NMC-1]
MSYEVIIPKPVKKQLDALPGDVRERILEKILSLVEDPRPSGIKKLKGFDGEYRIRVGDYRVRYAIDDQALTVLILHCQHRKDIYKS